MTVGIETKIARALLDRLATFAPAVATAWPAMNFTPTSGTPWLRPTVLPAQTIAMELGIGMNRHRGVFQVDVFWPEAKGITAPLETASAIAAHFKIGTAMTREGVTVRIVDPPYLSPALQEPSWIHVPVNVPYVAETSPP